MEAAGRVLQVNVSQGGVPKLPVGRAWVGQLGIDGDAHHERTVHGGPHRAVCLFGIEAIERLQAEGHPVEPGSTGENLTTAGIEWSTLPVGTRARIGDELLLEVASSTTPCATQRPNFSDGRFSRINIALHPADSRMYARVLREGYAGDGDPIELLPPAPDSEAAGHATLNRIDPVEQSSSLKLWAAARAAGFEVSVLDDGDICAGASRELAEPAFNHAQGLRLMPQLLPEVLAHFDRSGTTALIPHVAPAPGADPVVTISVHAATPAELDHAATLPDVDVIRVDDEPLRAQWIETYVGEMEPAVAAGWRRLLPHLLDGRDVHAFLARRAGRPAGVGLLYLRRGTGLLRGGQVVADQRGHGVQRALIAARAVAAAEQGSELVASMAPVGSVSARNLARLGLREVASHPVYEYVPGGG